MRKTGGGVDEVKNRSGKCEGREGRGEGARRVKEPEWEMRRIGRGGGVVDGVKNRSGKCEGLGRGGAPTGCIMHRVHTSLV